MGVKVDLLGWFDKIDWGRCDKRGGPRNDRCGVWTWKCARCAEISEARDATSEMIEQSNELARVAKDASVFLDTYHGEHPVAVELRSVLTRFNHPEGSQS